ncbi:glutenin, high molecular weight subunit PW212-like [Perognathus longimembris pacificus]|uniref:glutenin, high molecular weight subunit PW212-like n=1 Tax=Perognathus longimembris pacificus TaxID=214514 RepID=UPI002018E2FB|nr:glutenin, high molecular weight subunit PW212-like [Perognathus longimembris pacificus]
MGAEEHCVRAEEHSVGAEEHGRAGSFPRRHAGAVMEALGRASATPPPGAPAQDRPRGEDSAGRARAGGRHGTEPPLAVLKTGTADGAGRGLGPPSRDRSTLGTTALLGWAVVESGRARLKVPAASLLPHRVPPPRRRAARDGLPRGRLCAWATGPSPPRGDAAPTGAVGWSGGAWHGLPGPSATTGGSWGPGCRLARQALPGGVDAGLPKREKPSVLSPTLLGLPSDAASPRCALPSHREHRREAAGFDERPTVLSFHARLGNLPATARRPCPSGVGASPGVSSELTCGQEQALPAEGSSPGVSGELTRGQEQALPAEGSSPGVSGELTRGQEQALPAEGASPGVSSELTRGQEQALPAEGSSPGVSGELTRGQEQALPAEGSSPGVSSELTHGQGQALPAEGSSPGVSSELTRGQEQALPAEGSSPGVSSELTHGQGQGLPAEGASPGVSSELTPGQEQALPVEGSSPGVSSELIWGQEQALPAEGSSPGVSSELTRGQEQALPAEPAARRPRPSSRLGGNRGVFSVPRRSDSRRDPGAAPLCASTRACGERGQERAEGLAQPRGRPGGGQPGPLAEPLGAGASAWPPLTRGTRGGGSSREEEEEEDSEAAGPSGPRAAVPARGSLLRRAPSSAFLWHSQPNDDVPKDGSTREPRRGPHSSARHLSAHPFTPLSVCPGICPDSPSRDPVARRHLLGSRDSGRPSPGGGARRSLQALDKRTNSPDPSPSSRGARGPLVNGNQEGNGGPVNGNQEGNGGPVNGNQEGNGGPVNGNQEGNGGPVNGNQEGNGGPVNGNQEGLFHAEDCSKEKIPVGEGRKPCREGKLRIRLVGLPRSSVDAPSILHTRRIGGVASRSLFLQLRSGLECDGNRYTSDEDAWLGPEPLALCGQLEKRIQQQNTGKRPVLPSAPVSRGFPTLSRGTSEDSGRRMPSAGRRRRPLPSPRPPHTVPAHPERRARRPKPDAPVEPMRRRKSGLGLRLEPWLAVATGPSPWVSVLPEVAA